MEMLWLRAVVVFPLTIALLRFIGRGLQFQSRPYDLAVQVLLGSAAANLVVDSRIEIWRAFTALGTLAFLHTGLSFLSLWNPAKRFLVGAPSVVVENGQILRSNLIQHQISVDELEAALRERGFHDLADVEFAQVEASGKLSVIPRSQARPVTPRDLHLDTRYEGYPTTMIVDGTVNRSNLKKVKLTEDWLLGQLAEKGIASAKEVLYASLDTMGNLFVVRDLDVPLLRAMLEGVHAKTGPGFPPRVGD